MRIRIEDDQVPDHLIFYDGACPLCNASIRYVLKYDASGMYHFAPLEGKWAKALLQAQFAAQKFPDSIVLFDKGKVLIYSAAVFSILENIRGPASMFLIFRYLPVYLTDMTYRCVARLRRHLRPKHPQCSIPPPDKRDRFLNY